MAGRAHRDAQRLALVRAAHELLAEAVDHEQRVVDRDRDADQRDEVGHVDGHVHLVRQHPEQAQRDRHGAGGHQQRHERRGRRAEHDQQHEHRDRDRDLLAALQVGVEHGLQVVVDRDLPADVDAPAADGADGAPHRLDAQRRGLWLQARADLGERDARAGRLERADAGAGEHTGRPLQGGRLRGGRDVAREHDRVARVRPLAEVVGEQRERVLALGAWQVEAVREQVVELRAEGAADGRDREHGGDQPGRGDDVARTLHGIGEADHPVGPAAQRRRVRPPTACTRRRVRRDRDTEPPARAR